MKLNRHAREHLFINNANWARERVRNDPEFFRRLARQQAPEYLWIGCSHYKRPGLHSVTRYRMGKFVYISASVRLRISSAQIQPIALKYMRRCFWDIPTTAPQPVWPQGTETGRGHRTSADGVRRSR